jgi:hypothetical protein
VDAAAFGPGAEDDEAGFRCEAEQVRDDGQQASG